MLEKESGRTRAWILIRTESPEDAAHHLYEALGHQGGDSFVLVRADVVDYHYNIVVPVDAESWDVVHDIFCQIQRLTGAKEAAMVPVVMHIPYPPHVADGYIDEEEARADTRPEEIKIGRQLNSPGMNAWG